MHSVPIKKIVFLSIFILVLSSSAFQANATSYPVSTQKVASVSSTTANPVLTIQKRVNTTTVEVNTSIIVELIITNVGSSPIYNINLTEPMIQNPDIITKNLINPLSFAKFEPNEQRVISYTITSLKVANITIGQTSATYQLVNVPNAPYYTSYSQSISINVVAKTLSQSDVNINNLLILTVVGLFFCLIQVVRILFKITRKTSS